MCGPPKYKDYYCGRYEPYTKAVKYAYEFRHHFAFFSTQYSACFAVVHMLLAMALGAVVLFWDFQDSMKLPVTFEGTASFQLTPQRFIFYERQFYDEPIHEFDDDNPYKTKLKTVGYGRRIPVQPQNGQSSPDDLHPLRFPFDRFQQEDYALAAENNANFSLRVRTDLLRSHTSYSIRSVFNETMYDLETGTTRYEVLDNEVWRYTFENSSDHARIADNASEWFQLHHGLQLDDLLRTPTTNISYLDEAYLYHVRNEKRDKERVVDETHLLTRSAGDIASAELRLAETLLFFSNTSMTEREFGELVESLVSVNRRLFARASRLALSYYFSAVICGAIWLLVGLGLTIHDLFFNVNTERHLRLCWAATVGMLVLTGMCAVFMAVSTALYGIYYHSLAVEHLHVLVSVIPENMAANMRLGSLFSFGHSVVIMFVVIVLVPLHANIAFAWEAKAQIEAQFKRQLIEKLAGLPEKEAWIEKEYQKGLQEREDEDFETSLFFVMPPWNPEGKVYVAEATDEELEYFTARPFIYRLCTDMEVRTGTRNYHLEEMDGRNFDPKQPIRTLATEMFPKRYEKL